MKNKKITLEKILLSIFTVIICLSGTFFFSKMMFAHIHIHPPSEEDIRKLRESMKKGLENHRNEEVRKAVRDDDIPFVRKPRDKCELPNKLKPKM